jgi:hypothetical protein
MKTLITTTLNGLCVKLPTEFATTIADKIDELDSCNVIEIRNHYKSGLSSIMISDHEKKARKDIERILSEML